MDKEIPVREFLEKLINDRTEAHNVVHELVRKALELQAKEYERRLESLNHAHERSIEERSNFVTKAEGITRDERTHRLEQQLADLRERLIGRDHYESDMKALDLRIGLSEKSINTFKLFTPAGVFVGGLFVFIVEKIIGH